MDMEKVIKGLRHCTSHDDGRDKFGGVGKCGGCPYYGHDCTDKMKKDALALLEEKEAIKLLKPDPVNPISHYNKLLKETLYWCGKCERSIQKGDHYCPECGRQVKWK